MPKAFRPMFFIFVWICFERLTNGTVTMPEDLLLKWYCQIKTNKDQVYLKYKQFENISIHRRFDLIDGPDDNRLDWNTIKILSKTSFTNSESTRLYNLFDKKQLSTIWIDTCYMWMKYFRRLYLICFDKIFY